MKLTNTIRNAFIKAVMADVPIVDYAEQIRSAVMADIVSKLPPKIRAMWDDTSLRHWVKTDYNNYFRVSVTHPSDDQRSKKLSDETIQTCEGLERALLAQDDQRDELYQKLRACAYSAKTRKALVEMLPEFERYLPQDEPAAVRTLPVVQNVVADFVKAGWPASKSST